MSVGAKFVPETKYYLQKIFSEKSTACLYFVCCNCEKLGFKLRLPSNVQIKECTKCGSTDYKSVPEFVTFPIAVTLSSLLEVHKNNSNFHAEPPEPFPMEDVYNSKLYRDAVSEEGTICAIGLNSDGVKKFNKTKNSFYPLFIQTYNLRKEIRQKPENLIIFGLYNGTNLPTDSLIDPLSIELDFINNNGGIDSPVGRIPVYCINASLDSVARPKFQNHKQFNGRFGCSMCYSKGKSVGGSMKYPITYVKVFLKIKFQI